MENRMPGPQQRSKRHSRPENRRNALRIYNISHSLAAPLHLNGNGSSKNLRTLVSMRGNRSETPSSPPAASVPKVALLIETSRGYGRAMLRGIVRYARLHGPWSFYITP